jgi:hypothetical protein
MFKPHVIVDNSDGSIIAVFFQTEQALKYIQALSVEHGERVDNDPETYRFVWEDLHGYSQKFINEQLASVVVTG